MIRDTHVLAAKQNFYIRCKKFCARGGRKSLPTARLARHAVRMKTWRETSAVFAEIERLHAAGQAAALATLVRIEGSSYRRIGTRLLIRPDGSMLGQVSAGCLENDLRERAVRLLESSGPPEVIEYDTGGDENRIWGLGMGCNGRLDVFLQILAPPSDPVLAEIRCRFSGIESFSIRTVLDGADAGDILVGPPLTDEKSGIIVEGAHRVFVHHLDPPPDLVVVGAGEDAAPLVRIAAEAGFRVTVVDHRAAALDATVFPAAHRLICARPEKPPAEVPCHVQTFAVLKTHNIALDRGWLSYFAGTATPYIGLLGPRARRNELVAGLDSRAHARVFGPAGLDIGAEGPEQIAISILAEILAIESGRSAGFLRDRLTPIHA
jgi:xanthine/CO dehydrogenase XdhC/CoxF family maturation factor